MKQKQQKRILGHGTTVWDMARAVPSFCLGGCYILVLNLVFS